MLKNCSQREVQILQFEQMVFFRAPRSWLHCTLFYMMSLCGKLHIPSTLNTFWTRMENLGRGRPSFPFLQVSVCVLGSSWPGWSYSCFSPPCCRSFQFLHLLERNPVWTSFWEPHAVPNLIVCVLCHVRAWVILSWACLFLCALNDSLLLLFLMQCIKNICFTVLSVYL